MSANSGKAIVVALISFVGVVGAALISNIDKIEKYFYSDAPKVSFYKVDFFKGDKGIGNYNSCPKDLILLREVYKFSDEIMDQIVVMRSTTAGFNSKISIYPRGIDGHYEFNACAMEKDLSPLKVKSVFAKEGSEAKTVLNFDVNFTKDQLKDADEWSNRTP